MRITHATLTPLRLDFARPLRTARATYAAREGWLVRLVDESGHVGRGEAMPLPEFGTESLSETERALRQWSATLVGQPVSDSLDAIASTRSGDLARVERWGGARVRAQGSAADPRLPAAEHALEQALLELLALRRGIPLRQLFADAARSEVRVNALLGAATPDALADEARRAVAEGFDTLKVKVAGRSLGEDDARVCAVREAAGPSARIRLDANGGWSEPEAIHALRSLHRYSPELVEQPTPAEDWAALGRVAQAVPCPIAADESLASPEWRRHVWASAEGNPSASAWVLKPMVLGGLLVTLEWARQAERRGVRTFVTSSLDGVIARAGAAHLAAALPSGELASGLAVGRLFTNEPPGHPYQPVAGRIHLSGAPGIGWEEQQG
ncbi:o-succinylbenzoate synthase [Corallococcus sp. H22C18031201]|uniref:o-succinylbenzoate synthase n=1 Tax=Citreicoccus inhibens TaxID=2849499 RepID=UPI000E74C8F3|nr:o-succinylbenzoate synthase [Citreicoccus inhibens]MBU8897059.1 o-succinylbenzoate synthase [Citreicoccus inhibens]RJS19680.1 o-succinylbenzoate synthase [Corallococcus sp. H22C18031201]